MQKQSLHHFDVEKRFTIKIEKMVAISRTRRAEKCGRRPLFIWDRNALTVFLVPSYFANSARAYAFESIATPFTDSRGDFLNSGRVKNDFSGIDCFIVRGIFLALTYRVVVDGSNERFNEVSELFALVRFHARAEICDAMGTTRDCAPVEI